MTATERVAAFLLEMDHRMRADDGAIVLPISGRDVADYVGLTVETLSRIMTKFRRQGIVTASGRAIMLRRRGHVAGALLFRTPGHGQGELQGKALVNARLTKYAAGFCLISGCARM
jgi:hypothetical protein